MKMEALMVAAPYIAGGVIIIGGVILLEKKFGAGTPDPGGGAPSTGIIDGLLNHTFEIGKSSLNYTGATQQVVSDPLGTAKAILGISPSTPPASGLDFLVRGAKYLIRFNCPRQVDPFPGDVAANIQSWEGSSLSQISVTLPSSSELDVTFVYNGDGTDTMSSQAGEIMNAVADSDDTLSNIAFMMAVKA